MQKIKDLKLREGEQVLEIVYHHLIVIVPHLVVCLLILILDFFLMYFLFLQGWWGAALFLAVILAIVFYVFRLAFLYRKNNFVITSQRLLDFEQAGLFERFINEFPLAKINEAKAVIKGIGPTLFRYGNLRLALKGELGPFELYKVGNPLRLQDRINDLLNKNEPVKPISKAADPVALVMAEIELLDREAKEEIIRQVEQQLREEIRPEIKPQ